MDSSELLCVYRGVEQLVAQQAHNLEVAGSTPAPATNLQRNKLVLYNFLHRSKENLFEIVVTSLGCCSTQSTLANVRVLFFKRIKL